MSHPPQIDAMAAVLSAPVTACPTKRRTPVDCGDMPFIIKRDGTWLFRGSPIGRKELVCLFSGVLKRDATGEFRLETPVERGRIQVEEAPWIAVEMDWKGCCSGRNQCLTFRTNVDHLVTAGPDHPIRVAHDILTCEPTPYIQVRAGDGDFPLEARIGRSVYYELVAIAVPGIVHGRPSSAFGVAESSSRSAISRRPTAENPLRSGHKGTSRRARSRRRALAR